MRTSSPPLPIVDIKVPTSTTNHPIASPRYPSLQIQFRNELLQYQEQHLSLRSRWWRALSLYAFAKWHTADKGHPIGIPGERDPLFRCSAYQPRPRKVGDVSLCETDSHYLCQNCVENKYTSPIGK